MSPEKLVLSLFAFISMMVALGATAAAIGYFGGRGIVGVLAMAIGLKLFVSAIEDITKLDPNKLANSLIPIITLLGTFTTIMVLSSIAGKNADKAGVMMLMISASLYIMIGVIKALAKMDPNDVDSAVKSISKRMRGISVVIAGSGLAGEHAKQAGRMISKITGCLLLITGIIFILTLMDSNKVDHAVNCLLKLEAMFAILMGASFFTSKLKDTSVDAMSKMIVAIATLGIAMAILSNVDPDRLTASMTAISVAMMSMGASLKLINDSKVDAESILTMIIVMGAISSLLYLISGLPVEGSIGNSVAIGVLMLSLAGSLKMVSKCNSIGSETMAALGQLAIVMGLLSGLLKIIDLMNVSAKSETVAQLCIMLISLATVVKILSSFGVISSGVSSGIVAMGEITLAVIALASIIGAIMELVPEAQTALDTGLNVLIELFGAIGEMFGTLIGKFLGGLSAGLPDIAQDLTDFMTNIQGFLDAASEVDGSALNGMGYLVDAILKLTAAELLDRIASFVGGGKSMDKFCTDLITFASGLIRFSNVIKESNIDADTTEKVAKCGAMLAELENSLPRHGGWIQNIAGEKDLASFGERIKAFGTAMAGFFDSIKDLKVDGEKAEQLATVGTAMANLENAAARVGGIAQKLAGAQDLGDFGERIKAFGTAMVGFFNEIKDLKVDKDKASLLSNVGSSFAELENSTAHVGGIVDGLIGVQDLGQFGERIKVFGAGMKGFFTEIEGLNVDQDKAETLKNVGMSLSNLEDNLPKAEGKLFTLFTGTKETLDKFGVNIGIFGQGIKTYYDNIKGIDTSIADKSANTAKALIELDKASQDVEMGYHDLADIGEDLKGFGQKFSEFYDQIKGINTSQLSGVIAQMKRMNELAISSSGASGNGLNSMANSFQNVANACISTTADTISDGIDNVTSAIHQTLTTVASNMNDGLNNVLKTIKDKDKTFTLYGKNLILELANGMRNKISSVRNTASNIGQSAVNAINSYRSQFYSAGIYLVDGFANGIDSRTWYSTAKSKRMASLAAEAAKKELDEHSPSKRFFKIGAYGGEGFANGIDSMSKMVEASSVGMARTALDETNNVIAAIVSCISDNMDLTPTIAPVLDTSNIRDGVTSINSLLSNSAFGMNTNIDSVRSMMSTRQNGTNRELLGAIDKLGKQMSNIQSNSYTINGITYDNGSEVADAIETLVRATRIERRA